QIGEKDLNQRPITNLSNALAGVAPGIQTNAGSGQPGAGATVRIRGFGSINASNDPLYVVDGVPYSGSIANLNVDDIASMTILKDASSAALYGARAANGVILITTKTGKKGNDQLQFRAIQGISSRGVEEYDRVNAFEYYPLMWEAYRNSLAYGATPTPMATANAVATAGIKGLLGYNPFTVANNEIVGADGKINPTAKLLYSDFDWIKPLSRVGKRGDYSMTYSGGNDKSDHYLSLGYLDDNGFLSKTDYNRFTGRLKVNTNPVKWFKTGFNLSSTITKSNQASDGSSTGYVNPFYFARNIGPIYPVYAIDPSTGQYILDANGQKIYDLGNMAALGLPNRASGGSPGRHVVQETMMNDNLFKRNVLSGRTFGEITFLKDFKFTANASVDVTNQASSTYENKLVGDGAPTGRARKTNTTTTSFNLQQLLNYNKAFDKHSIEVLAGHEYYDYQYNYLTGSRNSQILDNNTELGNFTTTASLNSYTDRYRVEGYLSKLNYSYNDRYFLSGYIRRDGSSKFSPEIRWGNFIGAGAGWVISKESFMQNMNALDHLKLRTSYGQVGNDGLSGYYLYQSLYDLGFNNGSEPGFLQASLATPQLEWESNNSADIGLEFAMFKNRLSGTFEVFDRRSQNLLFNVPLPLSSGLLNVNKNIGTMYNKGVEIQLNGDVLKTKDFNWNANLNITKIKNKITKMPEETPEVQSGTKKLSVGNSLYEYYLRQWYGVDPADGAALYYATEAANTEIRNIDGKKLTTNINNAMYAYSGTAIPDFYGSFTNTFTYKKVSLSFLFNYQVGGKTYDSNYASLMSNGSYGGAMHVDALNRWQNPGDITSVPRMDVSKGTNFNAGTSTRWLIDASYLNLRSASLNYTLPKSWVSKASLKNASIYASGENLLIISKRKGMDPTQSFTGVTSNAYMPSRVISIGVNAAF
ncbi:MAG TPA: SusC/RagA family TonB-linked outer membrane protein, partial [Daejeonella sp.]|nr:SusC/RagA family TonB-linked outer membrane protein [Daejeonella sp.]